MLRIVQTREIGAGVVQDITVVAVSPPAVKPMLLRSMHLPPHLSSCFGLPTALQANR